MGLVLMRFEPEIVRFHCISMESVKPWFACAKKSTESEVRDHAPLHAEQLKVSHCEPLHCRHKTLINESHKRLPMPTNI